MNGKQIEDLLQLIDGNLTLTRDEAAKYIQEHHEAIIKSLTETGSATVETKAGKLELSMRALEMTPV